jgi:hypothetical protein
VQATAEKYREAGVAEGEQHWFPKTLDLLQKNGVEYEVYYKSQEFSTYNHWEGNIHPDRELCEDYLRQEGYSWTWEDGVDKFNALRYKKTFPLTSKHWDQREGSEMTKNLDVFFNQMVAHHWTFYMGHPAFRYLFEQPNFNPETYRGWPVTTRIAQSAGENSQLSTEDRILSADFMRVMRQIIWKHTIACDLNPGDVVMCDNYLVKHGRMPYPTGAKRKVYVSVTFDNEAFAGENNSKLGEDDEDEDDW